MTRPHKMHSAATRGAAIFFSPFAISDAFIEDNTTSSVFAKQTAKHVIILCIIIF